MTITSIIEKIILHENTKGILKKKVQTSYPYLTSFSFWLHPKKQLSKLREHHHGIKTQKKRWKYGKYCIYYGLAFMPEVNR